MPTNASKGGTQYLISTLHNHSIISVDAAEMELSFKFAKILQDIKLIFDERANH